MCESLRKKEKNVRAALEEALSCSRGRTRDSGEQRADSVSSGRRYPGGPSGNPPPPPPQLAFKASSRDCRQRLFRPPGVGPRGRHSLGTVPTAPSAASESVTRQQIKSFSCSLVSHFFEFPLPCCGFRPVCKV